MNQELGKLIVISGLILVIMGIIVWFSGKIPFLGKLPGDITIRRDNFTFYAPLGTSLLISLILTIIFSLISLIRK